MCVGCLPLMFPKSALQSAPAAEPANLSLLGTRRGRLPALSDRSKDVGARADSRDARLSRSPFALGPLGLSGAAPATSLLEQTIDDQRDLGAVLARSFFMISRWIEGIRARLGPRSVFIDGRAFAWPNEAFADPVHLLWPMGAEYTDFIATALLTDANNRAGHP